MKCIMQSSTLITLIMVRDEIYRKRWTYLGDHNLKHVDLHFIDHDDDDDDDYHYRWQSLV